MVPALKVDGEIVVQDAGADLEQQVGASGSPAHLLLLEHAFANDLVDSRLDERAGDRFTRSIPFAIVWDRRRVGPNVTSEFSNRLAQLALLGAHVHAVD